jgi:hypothetical protein
MNASCQAALGQVPALCAGAPLPHLLPCVLQALLGPTAWQQHPQPQAGSEATACLGPQQLQQTLLSLHPQLSVLQAVLGPNVLRGPQVQHHHRGMATRSTFVDRVHMEVKGGSGGNGCVSYEQVARGTP